MLRSETRGRSMLLAAGLLLATGLTGCLPAEEEGATVINGTGDAGTGAGGQGAGGNGQSGGNAQGGGVTPAGGQDQPGGGVTPSGGDPATGGQGQPGGEVGPGGNGPGGGGGEGGTPVCEPDCRGRVCGPDGCGGTCGRGCADGEVCAEGQCSSAGCPGDLIDCDGECSTLLDDVSHCGNCRTACPTNAGAGATPVCIEAECYLTCRGQENIPRSIDFDNDPENCGRCGNECPAARNGRAYCEGGRCGNPCERGDTLCQGRCFPSDDWADNCNGACCAVVRPGVQRGDAVSGGDTRAYTIEVDGAHRIRASLTFDDGSCPGFNSPFDTANESVFLSIHTGDTLGNRTQLSRGRQGLGTGEACVVMDTQVLDGAYEVVVQARENLPGYALNIEVLPAVADRANAATIDRAGVYHRAIPEDGRASIPMRFAAAQHLVVLAMADEVNNGYPEGCLFGGIGIEIGEGNYLADDDTNCAVLDVVAPAGDYTLHGERTFGDADPSYRAVVFAEAIGGPAAAALPEGGYVDGGALGAFAAAKYTFSSAGGQARFQLQGGDCANAAFQVVEVPWLQSNGDDPCAPVAFDLEAGDYTLWVHGARWNAVQNWAIQADVGGGGGPVGGAINRTGEYPQPAIPQGGQDTVRVQVARDSTVTLITSDGNGGCPADTTLTLMQNGQQVAYDDDGNSPCSRVSEFLPAGDYDAVVQGYNGAGVPAYVIEATFQ
jgi:hypothetical protein